MSYKEMLKNENISFNELYTYLQIEGIGDWDSVNDESTIRQFCSEMILKGILVSHILKVIEENKSEEGIYNIWLGNSMEIPTPINTKKELVEALGLVVKKRNEEERNKLTKDLLKLGFQLSYEENSFNIYFNNKTRLLVDFEVEE